MGTPDVPYKYRPDHGLHCDIQVGVRAYLAALHTTLQHHERLFSARAYESLTEQLDQLGIPPLLDQEGADHGETGAMLQSNLVLDEHLDDVGYGMVCPGESLRPVSGVCIADVHQEHGLIGSTSGAEPPYERFPIGSRVRILPNHACITAAAYNNYQVTDGANDVVDTWDRVSGW